MKYRKKKPPWITDEILDLCDKRRKLKSAKKDNLIHNTKYRDIYILKSENQYWFTRVKKIQGQCKHMKYG